MSNSQYKFPDSQDWFLEKRNRILESVSSKNAYQTLFNQLGGCLGFNYASVFWTWEHTCAILKLLNDNQADVLSQKMLAAEEKRQKLTTQLNSSLSEKEINEIIKIEQDKYLLRNQYWSQEHAKNNRIITDELLLKFKKQYALDYRISHLLSEEEHYLLDLLSFIQAFQIEQFGFKFPALFEDQIFNYPLRRREEARKLIMPIEWEMKGGVKHKLLSTQIVNHTELHDLLKKLNQAFIQSASFLTDLNELSFILESSDHVMRLIYYPSLNAWRLVDLNELTEAQHTTQNLDTLSKNIMDFFFCKNNLAFSMDLIFKGTHEKMINKWISEIGLTFSISEEMAKKTDDRNTSLLWITCQWGELIKCQQLLKEGADPNQSTLYYGSTPLTIACQNGHLEIVQELLNNHGTNPNKCTKDNESPLFMACSKGHIAVVQILLNHGADPNKCTKDNGSPLFIASQKGNIAIVQELLNHGADIEFGFSTTSNSLLDFTSSYGITKEMEDFLTRKKDSIVDNKVIVTPIEISQLMKHNEITKLLFEKQHEIHNRAQKYLGQLLERFKNFKESKLPTDIKLILPQLEVFLRKEKDFFVTKTKYLLLIDKLINDLTNSIQKAIDHNNNTFFFFNKDSYNDLRQEIINDLSKNKELFLKETFPENTLSKGPLV